MRRSRRQRYNQAGATLVEFAIILPLLLVLLFGIVESSRLFAEWASIRTAAREGARFATTTDSSGGTPNYRDCAGILDAAQAKSVLGNITEITVTWTAPGYTHTCTTGSVSNPLQNRIVSGTSVQVEVTSEFDAIVPLIAPFLDGIVLDTVQSREVFVGETTT